VADLMTALGLVLVIEGAVYALFPAQMQRLMALLITMPPANLRNAGLFGALLGLFLVWMVRA